LKLNRRRQIILLFYVAEETTIFKILCIANF
jgi:hypothetical protein